MLPSPSFFFFKKADTTQLETEFEENPLGPAVDSGNGQDGSIQQPPAARTKIFKLQREVKEKKYKIQQLRKRLHVAQSEAKVKGSLQAGGHQADVVEMFATTTDAEAPAKTQADVMKDLAIDESLSEEARESAKKALGMLVTSQIVETEQATTLSNLRSEVQFNGQFNQINQSACGTEMAQWLQQHRLLHHAATVIRVAGL